MPIYSPLVITANYANRTVGLYSGINAISLTRIKLLLLRSLITLNSLRFENPTSKEYHAKQNEAEENIRLLYDCIMPAVMTEKKPSNSQMDAYGPVASPEISSFSHSLALSPVINVRCLAIEVGAMQAKYFYFRGDVDTAVSILTALTSATTGGSSSSSSPELALLFNNFACLYIKSKRWILAECYLNRIVAMNIDLSKTSTHSLDPEEGGSDAIGTKAPLLLSSSNYRLAACLYNRGLVLLQSGRVTEAYSSFQKAGRCSSIERRPFLWIRMAECCIRYHLQQEDALIARSPASHDSSSQSSQPLVDFSIIPSLRSPRLLVKVARTETLLTDHVSERDEGALVNNLNLRSAVRCLLRALRIERDDCVPPSSSGVSFPRQETPSMLMRTILINISFAYLKLNEPENAIRHLEELLPSLEESPSMALADFPVDGDRQLPSQSKNQVSPDQHIFLGYCYYMEALTRVGREDKATEILSTKRDLLLSVTVAGEALRGCHIPRYHRQERQTNHLAAMSLQVNKAMLMIVNDQLEAAEKLLEEAIEQCRCCPGHRDCFPVVRNLLYLYLRLGKDGKLLRLLASYRQSPWTTKD